MIKKITSQGLLPRIFRGMEAGDSLKQSQVWLRPDFTLERGCRVCIAAESGSGKSSLLSFINGWRSDYDGRILFDGRDISLLNAADWSRLRTFHLSLLPQELCLFPSLTARENIQLKNALTNHKSTQQITTMLERLGIADKADTPVARMSVGQQQRVAIIRALCQPFDFIFLDEPVSHLDERNNREAATMITEEAAASGAGIISTSVGHNLLLPESTTIRL